MSGRQLGALALGLSICAVVLGVLGLHLGGLELDGKMTVGDLLVAGGTIALAWFTWRLARQTTRDVDQTTRSVNQAAEGLRLTRQGIIAADMPYVIPSDSPLKRMKIGARDPTTGTRPRTMEVVEESIRLDADDQSHERTLDVRLWNIGKGPAIVTSIRLTIGTTPRLGALLAPYPVAAGMARDVKVPMVLSACVDADESDLHGTMELDYLHSNGQMFRTTCGVLINSRRVTCETYAQSHVDLPANA